MNALYEIRAFNPVMDTEFLYHNWIQSYEQSLIGKIVPKSVYYPYQRKLIDTLLAQSDTEVRIACLPDEPNAILGFSVLQEDTVHYVYVKPHWRSKRIGQALLCLLPPDFHYTHLPPREIDLIRKKVYPESKYNPYLIGLNTLQGA